MDVLVERDGLYYKNFVKFTGNITRGIFNDWDTLGAVKNGKKEGYWVHFGTKGEPLDNLTGTYKNGVWISD